MPIVITPNMNLPVPVVGQELGPQYATDINNCLTSIDGHNHTPGFGVAVPSGGLNINSDLTYMNNRATNMKAATFFVQGSPLAPSSPDLGSLYVSGQDLYFNDVIGNQIQITSNGNVNAGGGSISGLVSPASASYVVGNTTFIWQSNVNTAASMDNGPVTIREKVANAKGVTLQSPTSLANDYSITLLPALPVSTLPLQIDSSGNVSADLISPSQQTSRISVGSSASIGQIAVSPSSGSFSTTSGSYVAVTGVSVTITTSGRPVMVFMQDSGSGFFGEFNVSSSNTSALANVKLDRGGTALQEYQIQTIAPGASTVSTTRPPSSINFLDIVAAGTYTYSLFAEAGNGNSTITVQNMNLIAYEI